MKVRWTPAAERDRAEIFNYIAVDSPRAAAKMDEIFSSAAARLTNFPHLGRPGRVAGTRELIAHRSYMLVYEIDDESVWILRLIHTSRLWPPAPE